MKHLPKIIFNDYDSFVRYCPRRHIKANGLIAPSAFMPRKARQETYLSGMRYEFFKGTDNIIFADIINSLKNRKLHVVSGDCLMFSFACDICSKSTDTVQYSVRQFKKSDAYSGIFFKPNTWCDAIAMADTVYTTLSVP